MQVAENNQVEYATLNRRMLALTLDSLILIIVLFPASMLIEYIVYGGKMMSDILTGAQNSSGGPQDFLAILNKLSQESFFLKWFAVQFFVYVLTGVLYLLCWWKAGTTPGKWVAECKILDEKTLTEPTRMQYLLRFLAFVPSCLPLSLGFLMLGLDKKKRAWHDRMVGTVVVVRRHDWKKITNYLSQLVKGLHTKIRKYI